MNKAIEFLKHSDVLYFATIGLDGKPKVRPFQFMFEENDKLYFCTSPNKDVYRELQLQPFVELCSSGSELSWLRMSARVVFTNETAIKARILDVSPLVKSIYNTPDNPNLIAFYLKDITAIINNLNGVPAEIFRF